MLHLKALKEKSGVSLGIASWVCTLHLGGDELSSGISISCDLSRIEHKYIYIYIYNR